MLHTELWPDHRILCTKMSRAQQGSSGGELQCRHWEYQWLFGALRSNSRLEIWLLKLCLLRGRRHWFVDFGLRLKNAQGWWAPASFPGQLWTVPETLAALWEKCQSSSKWFLSCYTAPHSKWIWGFHLWQANYCTALEMEILLCLWRSWISEELSSYRPGWTELWTTQSSGSLSRAEGLEPGDHSGPFQLQPSQGIHDFWVSTCSAREVGICFACGWATRGHSLYEVSQPLLQSHNRSSCGPGRASCVAATQNAVNTLVRYVYKFW